MIRHARLKDAEAITQLAGELGYITQSETVEEQLAHFLDQDDQQVMVYEVDEQICGWIQYGKTYRVGSAPFVEITGLIVDVSLRRRGIARDLVSQAISFADDQQVKIRVRCNSRREEAHKFYQSLGFVLSKQQHVFELG